MASAEKVPMLAEGHAQLNAELKRLKSRASRGGRGDRGRARPRRPQRKCRISCGQGAPGPDRGDDRRHRGPAEPGDGHRSQRRCRATRWCSARPSTLIDEDEKKVRYQLVGQTEADAKVGRISYNSPLGRALIGRQKGEEVEVTTPSGDRYYEIAKIEFI